jgi:acetyl-CoA carboxylase biotin carboxyl carrier protein
VSSDALPSWSDLLALVKHLEITDFEDFVVEMPGLTVRVSRHGLAETAAVTSAAGTEHVTASSVAESATPDEQAAHHGGAEITAPIVGMFYRGPAPEQPPFVAVGDVVAVGATTAVIEVMKMMVPVEADVAGRIVAVLAEDGEMVEAGQPLFVVDTGGVT